MDSNGDQPFNVPAANRNRHPNLTISILLLAVAFLLIGNGAFGTVLGVRASALGFDTVITGIVMSAYFLGFVIGSYVCLKAVLAVGHIRAFAALAAIVCATSLTHPLLPTALAWGILRGVAGICMVGLYIIIESWLNSQATPQNRGKVFGIYMTVNLSAIAAGQFLLTINDPTGFIVFSTIAILFALALVPLSVTPVAAPTVHIVRTIGIRHLFRIAPVGVAACFASGIVGGGVWGMLPVFAQKIGLDAPSIASFMSALIVGGLLFQFPFGYISDRNDRRAVILVASFATATISMVFVFLGKETGEWMIVGAFFFGGFYFPIYAVGIARVNDLLEPSQILGATRGLMLIYGLGASVGPFLAGTVMELLTPKALFPYFALILYLMSGYALLGIKRRGAMSSDDQPNVMPITPVSPVAAEFEPRAAADIDRKAIENAD